MPGKGPWADMQEEQLLPDILPEEHLGRGRFNGRETLRIDCHCGCNGVIVIFWNPVFAELNLDLIDEGQLNFILFMGEECSEQGDLCSAQKNGVSVEAWQVHSKVRMAQYHLASSFMEEYKEVLVKLVQRFLTQLLILSDIDPMGGQLAEDEIGSLGESILKTLLGEQEDGPFMETYEKLVGQIYSEHFA